MKKLILFVFTSLLIQCVIAQQLAFPTAEGFGQFASGGRGGTVYHVTHLNDTGVGSFRDAVSKPNRTVVFDVGGIIRITSIVPVSSNITIAGQTAPGDGICIYGAGLSYNSSTDVITRYLRVRAGIIAPSGTDAIGARSGKKMMFDHLSVSWGRDGTFDLNGSTIDSITMQNMIISHGLIPHSTGGLMNSEGNISVLRSLYINNWTRNPKVTCNNQYVNNVIYNWGASSYNFGGANYTTYSNLTNNYMISGQGGTRPGIMGGDPYVNAYLKGNFWDSNRNGKLDGTEYTAYSDSIIRSSTPFSFPVIKNEMTAVQSYYNVIANAGASLHRDKVDSLLMIDLKSLGTKGIFIRTEDTLETKGPGIIKGGTTPLDTDQDGMPDAWEKQFGFNYLIADNNGDADKDGYTNLEEYLNCLVGEGNCTPPACLANISFVGNSELCEGENITLIATSGKAYKWFNGTTQVSTSASITTSIAGSYTVEVTNNNGCKKVSNAVIVTVNALPIIIASVKIDAGSWKSNLLPIVCKGGQVSFGPSPTYATGWLWTGPNNFTSTFRAPVLSNSQSNHAGSYTATYTDANGCSASVTYALTVSVPVATITSTSNSFCTGKDITLTANSGASYKWFKGTTQVGTSQTYKANTPDDYTVQVTNSNACTSTSAVKTITENALPVLTHNTKTDTKSWSQSTDFSVCVGENVYTGPWPNRTTDGWNWTGPNGFTSTLRSPILSNVVANQSGKYTASYTDGNGCSASLDLNLFINAPEAITFNYQVNGGAWKKGVQEILCDGDNIQFAAWPLNGSTWSWSGPNGFTSGLRNPLLSNVAATEMGVYKTTHTDVNGCKASASFTLDACVVTALEEAESSDAEVEIYPNPSSEGNVRLNNKTNREQLVVIYTLMGQEVERLKVAPHQIQAIHLSQSGYYLIHCNYKVFKLFVE